MKAEERRHNMNQEDERKMMNQRGMKLKQQKVKVRKTER